jgi:hypothetical protein
LSRQQWHKLQESLMKYREAVMTSSPELPSRRPGHRIPIRLNPDGVASSS